MTVLLFYLLLLFMNAKWVLHFIVQKLFARSNVLGITTVMYSHISCTFLERLNFLSNKDAMKPWRLDHRV